MAASFPVALAKHVRAQLLSRKEDAPSLSALTTLFETLYFASLKQEENQPIACRVAFLDRKQPDPDPPARIVANRWQCCALGEDLPLSVRNLVKLATAVDPWGSTLAVDIDSYGDWRIWGLIDQSVHYSTYIFKEAADGPEMPGMFQVVIQGIGEIAVYQTYLLLGSLTQDVIVKKQQGVLQFGPVRSKLTRPIEAFQKRVRSKVGGPLYDEWEHWDKSLEQLWVSAVCRILIGIQKYHHGGALLISDSSAGLNIKYSLPYRRLGDALLRLAVLRFQNVACSDEIHREYLDKNIDEVPTGLYLEETISENDIQETGNEVTGCVRFLASLARIDGLIWLDSRLRLKGFGVEITSREDPSNVAMALNARATKTSKLDLNHFGTRHRSMLRYCATNPNSVGFIISQDGDVRAATQFESQVLLWDNIRIQSVVNARALSHDD
jgi:hypothetical protein